MGPICSYLQEKIFCKLFFMSCAIARSSMSEKKKSEKSKTKM